MENYPATKKLGKTLCTVAIILFTIPLILGFFGKSDSTEIRESFIGLVLSILLYLGFNSINLNNKNMNIYSFFYYREDNKVYCTLFKYNETVYGVVCNENGEDPQKMTRPENLLNFAIEKGNRELIIPKVLKAKIEIFLDSIYYSGNTYLFNNYFKAIWNSMVTLGINWLLI